MKRYYRDCISLEVAEPGCVTSIGRAELLAVIQREEVGIATWECERRKNRGQVGDPLAVDSTIFLPGRVPSCDDFHQKMLPTQAECGRIRGDLRACPMEVVQGCWTPCLGR